MKGRGNGRMRRFLPGAAVVVAVLAVSGCFGPRRGPAPPPPPAPERPLAAAGTPQASAVIPPVVPLIEEPEAAPAPPASGVATVSPKEEKPWATLEAGHGLALPLPEPSLAAGAAPASEKTTEEGPEARREAPKARLSGTRETKAGRVPPAGPPTTAGREVPSRETRRDRPAHREGAAGLRTPDGAPPPERPAPAPAKPPVPGWAKQKEVLVYRVDFIGITMGYARFRYQGKVSIGGKPAYHLNVRAWTSGILSYIYPINETIDYYLDVGTLAPLRQEFTERDQEKDDVAIYDQETGKITYRYRQSGKIRKQVETVPEVYDPVSVAYYFRWRDGTGEDHACNVYAGRKVWQISAKLLGTERIRTELGEVDTILIRPVIRRNGKVEDKGDLKVWFSRDERHVPVRLYAKFHKIKDWTLVGELVPAQEGG